MPILLWLRPLYCTSTRMRLHYKKNAFWEKRTTVYLKNIIQGHEWGMEGGGANDSTGREGGVYWDSVSFERHFLM